MGMVGEACLPSNAYYPRTPDYTLCSGVHVCWSEHSDSSFVYGFMILDYDFGTMTATTFLTGSRMGSTLLQPMLFYDNERWNYKNPVVIAFNQCRHNVLPNIYICTNPTLRWSGTMIGKCSKNANEIWAYTKIRVLFGIYADTCGVYGSNKMVFMVVLKCPFLQFANG